MCGSGHGSTAPRGLHNDYTYIEATLQLQV